MLPEEFAIKDNASDSNSRYYLFATSHSEGEEFQTVYRYESNYQYTISTHDGFPFTNETRVVYEVGDETLDKKIHFWYSGIDLIPSYEPSNKIPVLDCKDSIFLLRKLYLKPVRIVGDDVETRVRANRIHRTNQNIAMDLINPTATLVRYRVATPPPIRRVTEGSSAPPSADGPSSYISPPATPLLLSRSAEHNTLNIPPHAIAAIVRGLVSENKDCCITTTPFSEISIIGITPCFHCFEGEALEKWISKNPSCPECRSEVKIIKKYSQTVAAAV
jgi:hypothetical protein